MANPVFDRATLINNSACYSLQTLTSHQREAIDIYLLAVQLAAIGGTNYVGSLRTTLIPDSVCFVTLQPDQVIQVRTQIDKNNAVNAGGSIGTIDAQLNQVSCLQNASMAELQAAKTLLLAKLGYAKTYPQ